LNITCDFVTTSLFCFFPTQSLKRELDLPSSLKEILHAGLHQEDIKSNSVTSLQMFAAVVHGEDEESSRTIYSNPALSVFTSSLGLGEQVVSTQQLDQNKKVVQDLQKEQQESNKLREINKRLMEALKKEREDYKQMLNKEKEEFKKDLEEMKTNSNQQMREALQKEREANKQERENHKQTLNKERREFKKELEALKKADKKEKDRLKEEIELVKQEGQDEKKERDGLKEEIELMKRERQDEKKERDGLKEEIELMKQEKQDKEQSLEAQMIAWEHFFRGICSLISVNFDEVKRESEKKK